MHPNSPNMPSNEKPDLTALVRDNPKTPEGKYLVMRRDGTVPDWQWFVLGARDPMVPLTLRFYALYGWVRGYFKWSYVRSVFRFARDMNAYRKDHGTGDPHKGLHRKDNPAIIELMRKGKGA